MCDQSSDNGCCVFPPPRDRSLSRSMWWRATVRALPCWPGALTTLCCSPVGRRTTRRRWCTPHRSAIIQEYQWLLVIQGGKQTCFSTLLLFSMYKLEIPGSMGGEINLGGEKSLCSPPSTKNQLCIHHTASQTCIETILRISLANGHCVVKWCNVYISPWSLPGQKCWWVKLLLYRSSIGSTVISLYVESIRELSHGRFWSWTSLVW